MTANRRLPVYLAGPSRELARVQRYADALEQSGLVRLTYAWQEAVLRHGVGRDHELTLEQQREHALADLRGVCDAELVWALWPESVSAGVPLEFGFAMGLCRYYSSSLCLVVSGAKASNCIFTSLAVYRDASDDLALVEVLRRAQAYRRGLEALAVVP